jgi:diacylglycerol kinase family enzyme
MRATVLLNPAAGALAGDSPVERVTAAFARTTLEFQVRPVEARALAEALRAAAASGADLVVLGGGDGTLGMGAQALAGSGKALGILPLGTLNHFAQDLGIPRELDEAVRTIDRGHVREVDVGEANGRVFLNNCSIGLYPHLVRGREELRHRFGGSKWLAMFRAALDVFRRFPLVHVTLRIEDRESAFATPFVFLGNNRYDMRLFALGRRSRVDGGELGVYFSRNRGRLGLLRLTLLGLLGRLEQDRDFSAFAVPGVEVDTRRGRLRVALDGELTALVPPLRCRSRPRALRVVAPPPQEVSSSP